MAEEIGEALIEVMPDLGDFENTLVGGVSSASEEAAEAATDALGQITESAENTAENTVEAFEDAGEEIAGQFEEASEEATDSLDELADIAEETAEGSIEAFEDAGEEIAGQFEEASEDAADALGEVSEAASDTFDEIVDASEDASAAVEDVAESAGDIGTAFDEAADDVESAFDGAFAGIADDASAAADDASTALSDIDVDVGDLGGAFDGLIDEAESAGAEIADSISGGAAEAEDSLESLSSVGTATLDEVNDAAGDAGDELAGAFGDGEAAAIGSLGAVADAGGGIGAALDDGSALATTALLTIALSTRQTASRMRDLGDTGEEVSQQITDAAERASEAIDEIEPPDFGDATVPPLPEPPDRGSFDGLQEEAEEVSEGLRVTFANGFDRVLVTARHAVTQIVTLLHDIAGSGEAPIVAQAMADAFDQGAQESQAAISRAVEQITSDLQSISEEEPDEAVARGFDVAAGEIASTFSQLRETAFNELTQFGVAGDEASAVLKNTLLGALTSIMDALDSTAEEAESTARVLADNVPAAIEQISGEVETVRGGLESAFAGARDAVITSFVGMSDEAVAELHRIAGSGAASEVAAALRASLTQAVEALGPVFQSLPDLVRANFDDIENNTMSVTENVRDAFDQMGERVASAFQDPRDQAIQTLTDMGVGARDASRLVMDAFDSLGESVDSVVGPVRSVAEGIADVAGAETGAEVVGRLGEGMSDLRSSIEPTIDDLQSLIVSLEGVEQQGDDFDQIVSGLGEMETEEDIFSRMQQDLQGAGQEALVLLDTFRAIMDAEGDPTETFRGAIVGARNQVDLLREAMHEAMDLEEAGDVDIFLGEKFEEVGQSIIQSMRNARDQAVDRLNDIDVSDETQSRVVDAFDQVIGDVGHMFASLENQFQENMEGVGDSAAEAALAAEQPLSDLAAALEVTIPGATQVAVEALDGMAVQTQSEIADAADNANVESFGTLGERAATAVTEPMEGLRGVLRQVFIDARNDAIEQLRGGDFEAAAEGIEEDLSIDPAEHIGDLRDAVLEQLQQMGVDAVDVTNSIHSAFRRLQDEIPGIFDDLRFYARDALEDADGDAEVAAENIAEHMQSGMANVEGAIRAVMDVARARIRSLVDIHGQATQEMADDWEDPRTSAEQMFDHVSDAIHTAFGGGAERATEVVQDAVNSMQGAFEGLDPEEAAEAVGDAFADIDLSVHIQQAMDEAEETLRQQGISGDQVTEALRTNIDDAAREMADALEGGVSEGMAAVEDAIETGREPMEALVDAVGDLSGEFEQSLGGAAEEASREITELVGYAEDLSETVEDVGEQVEDSLGGDAIDAVEEMQESLGDEAVEAAEEFGGAVEDVAGDAEEALGDDVVEAVGEVQDALGEDAVEAAEEFGESVDDAAEDAQDALDETVDSVGEFTDAVDDAVGQVGDAASEMGDSFGGFQETAVEAGEEVEESIGDSLQGTADIGSEVTDDLQQMFIESADAVGENFAQAAEEVGDSLEEEAAGRGMEAFAEIEDSAEETAASVNDAFDGIGGGIADSFDTAAGGAEGGGGRISAAMAGAAGGAAASSGKIAAILGSSAVKFGAWATAGVAAAGAVIEAFARSEQDLNVTFANIDDALDDLSQSARDVAIDIANVTFPLDEVAALIDIARRRGLETSEQLEDFAGFWDMVGDASGESATKLAQMSPALQLVGVELGNEEEALDSFGFLLRNTDATMADFLGLLERAGQEFGEQGPTIEEMAGAVALLEDSGFRAERAQRILQRELRQTEGDLVAALDQIATANSEDLPEFIAQVEGSGDAVAEQAENFRDFRTPMEAVASVWDRLTTVFGGASGVLSPLTELIEDVGDVTIEWATAFRDGIEASEGFTGGLESVLEQMGLVHESVDTPPAFHEVADEATAAFHEVADDSRGIFDLIFEGLGGAIAGLGSFIADNSDAIIDGILALKTQVVDAGLALFEGIVDALPQLINDLVDGTVDLINAISEVLVESTPAIVEGAVDLLTGLLDAIPIVLPMLIDGALEIILAIVQALTENVGPLITAGVDALLVLIDGILQALPVLIETIGTEVIPALIDALVEHSPTIIEAGVDLIVALIDGLAVAIPRLIDAVFTEIIPAVIGALDDNHEAMGQAGLDIGWALINGILSILDALGQAIWDIADHIRMKFVEFLAPIIDDVIDWFRDLPGDAKVAIISQAFELVNAGRDLVRGIWDGITSMGDWLKRKLMGWAADVLPGPVADVLGLSSPSTVFAEMGRDVVRGLTEGIEDEEDGVIAEIERFANEMSSIDLMLGDPSISGVEGEIDRAAARRRGDGSREGGAGGDHVEVTVHQQPSETPIESTMRALRRARYLSAAGRRGARR